ncbi:MAG: hypothetical protein LBC74_01500 [Planctomycetaceae bacterium]|jgi:GTP-binding protein EngB required for normal cell division|nr:hypothetical protein [Planctomycetaceae bacterium]
MLPEIHYPVMQELLVDILNYGYFNTPKLTKTICEKIRKYTEEKGGIKMPVCLYDKMLAKIQKAEAEKREYFREAHETCVRRYWDFCVIDLARFRGRC